LEDGKKFQLNVALNSAREIEMNFEKGKIEEKIVVK
jgi:hypothetical protein